MRIRILLLLAASSLYGAEETITLDPGAQARPFPHFWERMFGSGRAILAMRESYLNDLRATKKATGFEYVRFHGIFNDEVGVYNDGAHYNFSYVDQIYDGLLANGVRPFVELSFMPKDLAAKPVPHAFWYKPYPSPPKDMGRWTAMVTAFTKHLVERYGADEVRLWYFEVWNEPNIDFWTGEPKEQTYYALYDATARAIKAVDAKLRVGGPSTAQAAWVDRFLAHCRNANSPFDFVSTHVYGNEKPEDVFGKPMPIERRDMVARAIEKARAQAGIVPLIVSEFNATYLNEPSVTDSAFMGPWLANTIRECDGLAQMMSLWTFSDVFEEQGVVKRPFYGGYGLIAERGIPKPAFRALELLHELGGRRVLVNSDNALVTMRDDSTFALALWNYAEPGVLVEDRVFHLRREDDRPVRGHVRVVDPAHGSAMAKWDAMGRPDFPTREQIAQLIEASKIGPESELKNSEVRVTAQGLALVRVDP
jgi:xylan 1,4-beta-xylosidase